MIQGDIMLYVFLFLLRVCLFTVTGIVLHSTEATRVVHECPALWETMAITLVAKCLRLTLCAVAFKVINRNPPRTKGFAPFDLVIHMGFFVSEVIVTSRSLNMPECVAAASEAFDGHPLIMYVNGISCAWDGCYILACALFVVLNK
jgi:hypothetical protein